MKVGIIGDKKRASAWETHLRPLASVSEVTITPTLAGARDSHAILLLDDSDSNLDQLSEAIRLGIHCYLVSRLPNDVSELRNIDSMARESDVRVQLSHWPSLSPATRWMQQHLPGPRLIQVIREQSHVSYTENRTLSPDPWIDEVAWITKWMDSRPYRIEAHHAISGRPKSGMQTTIQFENGASASLWHLAIGSSETHRRIASGPGLLLDWDVLRQSVKRVRLDEKETLSADSQDFEATRSAELSVLGFLKAIRMRRETAFTPYDALRAAGTADKIREMLR